MGIISTGPGSPLAFASASGGKVYGFNNISTTPQVVAAINPSRQRITFHNPGVEDIFIAPSFIVNTGTQVALVPSLLALGGCWRLYANGGSLELSGECQGEWQAFAAAGATNPFTIMDSNT